MLEAPLRRRVEARLAAIGQSDRIVSATPVSGGCIHRTLMLELHDGSSVFLKSIVGSLPTAGTGVDVFKREAEGLAALGEAGALRVPQVLGVENEVEDGVEAEDGAEDGAGCSFLILEAIQPGRPKRSFFPDFGRRLANLHRKATAHQFGFAHDNYLGATAQPNPWTADWVDFWAEHRLGHQLRLARRRGFSDPELEVCAERLIDRLPELIGSVTEPPSLLHGDLWSGNFMVDAQGEPVLIDPAAYYGHREAELAMCHLFGGFERSFFEAYEDAWPLAPGAEQRLDLYQLYHLLNHLNLFGSGYRSQCLAILKRLT